MPFSFKLSSSVPVKYCRISKMETSGKTEPWKSKSKASSLAAESCGAGDEGDCQRDDLGSCLRISKSFREQNLNNSQPQVAWGQYTPISSRSRIPSWILFEAREVFRSAVGFSLISSRYVTSAANSEVFLSVGLSARSAK